MVVGLGGSAGSLDVLQKFFSKVPPDTGIAFVVVVHLSPEHESSLAAILSRSSVIPVVTVSEPALLLPNQAYVIPPGKHLALVDGFVHAVEMNRPRGRHVAIDLLFRTLAECYGSSAAAVILSGGDGDGALGLKRVKELGGLTICQDPNEAEQGSMPRAAMATQMVDCVLPVEEMPARILKYLHAGNLIQLPAEEKPAQAEQKDDEVALHEVLGILKAATGHDFTSYKRATVLRRVARRMQVNSCGNLPAYRHFLSSHPGETGALLQDLLISVTNFFRDPEAFRALEVMLPDLFRGKGPTDQVRVWVPACATGEEAYSVAILLSEYAEKLENPPQIQIFATDLDQSAIEIARQGRYPESIDEDVSDDRLRHFFELDAGNYRVRRQVRELILFAVHDVLKNSPFSKLDLICCRNLLIYLNRQAQAKVFDIFHFALRPGGYLFLGASESAEEAGGSFTAVDKKHRLYLRQSLPKRAGSNFPSGMTGISLSLPSLEPGDGVSHLPASPSLSGGVGDDVGKRAYASRKSWAELHYNLIEHIAPPSLVVSSDSHIVHLSKSAGMYLQFSGGEPTTHVLSSIHPSLRPELRAGLFRAGQSRKPVYLEGLSFETSMGPKQVDITVEPIEDVAPGYMLVVFHDRREAQEDVARQPATDCSPAQLGLIQHLEDELDQLKHQLGETVDQYEASNEELKASNEELQAMNEELRSATEELETGREELQSINEEIITINQELKTKVEELSRANSDLQNLMASTNIATIFLDRQLRIKRFTPSTTDLFNLIVTDIGRRISDLTHKLVYPGLVIDAAQVLDDLKLLEREIRDQDGRWFLARLLPYRTPEDQVAGVVITCVDITARKAAEETGRWLSAMVESSNDAIFSFTMDGTIVSWNRGAERIFGYTADEMIGCSEVILTPPERMGELMDAMEKLRRSEPIAQFETVRLRNDGSPLDVSLSSSIMRNELGEIVGATSIVLDVTGRKAAMEQLKQAKEELEVRVEERTAELRKRASQISLMASDLTFSEQRERKRMAHILHDEFQQLLVAAKMKVESLAHMDNESRKLEIAKLVRLMDEVLSNSRSLGIELSPPILAEGLPKALEWLCGTWMKEKHDLVVHRQIDLSVETPHEDMRILLFLAVKELLFNTVKHSGVNEAFVELSSLDPEQLRIRVIDRGCGFHAKDGFPEKEIGSCFGLMSIRERLEMLGGHFQIIGKPGQGVEAIIIAPRLT